MCASPNAAPFTCALHPKPPVVLSPGPSPPGGPDGSCLHSSPQTAGGREQTRPGGCQAAVGTTFPVRGLAVGGQDEPSLCGVRRADRAGVGMRAGGSPPGEGAASTRVSSSGTGHAEARGRQLWAGSVALNVGGMDTPRPRGGRQNLEINSPGRRAQWLAPQPARQRVEGSRPSRGFETRSRAGTWVVASIPAPSGYLWEAIN